MVMKPKKLVYAAPITVDIYGCKILSAELHLVEVVLLMTKGAHDSSAGAADKNPPSI